MEKNQTDELIWFAITCILLFTSIMQRRRAEMWRKRCLEESDQLFLVMKKLELAEYALKLLCRDMKDIPPEFEEAFKKSEDLFA